MSTYQDFRRDLDAVLVTRDPQALRRFLIEQEQWTPDTTMDPEAAMWLMIAASPGLASMHPEARAWLKAHGRGADAAAIGGEPGTGKQQPSRPQPKQPPHHPGDRKPKS